MLTPEDAQFLIGQMVLLDDNTLPRPRTARLVGVEGGRLLVKPGGHKHAFCTEPQHVKRWKKGEALSKKPMGTALRIESLKPPGYITAAEVIELARPGQNLNPNNVNSWRKRGLIPGKYVKIIDGWVFYNGPEMVSDGVIAMLRERGQMNKGSGRVKGSKVIPPPTPPPPPPTAAPAATASPVIPFVKPTPPKTVNDRLVAAIRERVAAEVMALQAKIHEAEVRAEWELELVGRGQM